jgi:L,D-peptidoglycan transpeptidase YkuD (ErfK/YbiS/YcfS/YnhG family)
MSKRMPDRRSKRRLQIVVRQISRRSYRGLVQLGLWTAPCVVGRSGARALKREGDGATPIGRWTVREVRYRADRTPRPQTTLHVRALRNDDGWCDAPEDRNYNRAVRHPYPASAERLWREDELYDLVAVLGYNDVPRRRTAGSAIFMHLMRADRRPTEGCVALAPRHLRFVLARVRGGMRVRIGA